MQKHESAFTLIELMIAIAVAAVVLTLGVPGFGRVIEEINYAALISMASFLLCILRVARRYAVIKISLFVIAMMAQVVAVLVMRMVGSSSMIITATEIMRMPAKN